MQVMARAVRVEDTRNGRALNDNGYVGSPLRAVPKSEPVTIGKLYPRNAAIFCEGETGRGAYVLRTGRVKISISSADGKKLIMRLARPGDVLGLYAGFDWASLRSDGRNGRRRPRRVHLARWSIEVDARRAIFWS